MSSPVHVSVVIPVYNARRLAAECVASIFAAATTVEYEVIVVDNGSTPDVEEWLGAEQQRHANLRYLRYAKPLGFAVAVNAGAASARGEVIILLNSDTLVTPAWMDGLYNALVSDASLGAITPLTNSAGDAAQIDLRTVALSPARALKLVAAKPRPQGIISVAHRLTFFCVALRRSVWTEFGGLDESYAVGNYEDDHLCLRLRVAGYRLGIAAHVFVYHYSNATFRANDVQHDGALRRNAAIFATHARAFALESAQPQPPAFTASIDVSVVVLANPGAALEQTMVSLKNQTVAGFEIVHGSGSAATRTWIAYVSAGDIWYPFHLEALTEALEQSAAEAAFSDAWIADAAQHASHPDTRRVSDGIPPGTSSRPLMMAGWIHHRSLDAERLWDETLPVHLPRMTWQRENALVADSGMPLAPTPPSAPASVRESPVDVLRRVYRRVLPYETRLEVDRLVRGWLRLPETDSDRRRALARQFTANRRRVSSQRAEPGRFAVHTAKPAVFLFSIIPWQSLVQRPHHFARGLAERGHPVFWVDTRLRPPSHWSVSQPLPEVVPGVHQLLLPGTAPNIYHQTWEWDSVDMMSAALEEVASAYGVREAVSIVNFPRWEPVVTDARKRFGWNIVYDCLDDQPAFADLFKTQLSNYEQRLVDTASVVTVSGFVLRDHLRRQRDVVLLPNGADFELFSSHTPIHPLASLAKPVVGFFGSFADWLDTELIRAAALRFPDWSFVFIGWMTFSNADAAERWAQATNLPNVHVIPQVPPATLVTYLTDFDVCTMPFRDIPVTRAMNAVKLYEYLAAGKHVVTRDLPEIRRMVAGDANIPGAGELIARYSSDQEFFAQLEAAVAAKDDGSGAARRRFAQMNDWSFRVDRLSAEIVRVAGAAGHDTSSRIPASNG